MNSNDLIHYLIKLLSELETEDEKTSVFGEDIYDDGDVLRVAVCFPKSSAKVYDYVLLKKNNSWYSTGEGTDCSWKAVVANFVRSGAVLLSISRSNGWTPVYKR